MSVQRARELRRNMTDAEQFVWSKLRGRRFANYKFRRQVTIGSFIADVVCFERKLVLELDGGQHAEQAEYDRQRTAWLERQGFRVLRFWNHEVLREWDWVEEILWAALQASPSPPAPLPPGERGES